MEPGGVHTPTPGCPQVLQELHQLLGEPEGPAVPGESSQVQAQHLPTQHKLLMWWPVMWWTSSNKLKLEAPTGIKHIEATVHSDSAPLCPLLSLACPCCPLLPPAGQRQSSRLVSTAVRL